jgi:hypothetical protein
MAATCIVMVLTASLGGCGSDDKTVVPTDTAQPGTSAPTADTTPTPTKKPKKTATPTPKPTPKATKTAKPKTPSPTPTP